MSIAIILAAGLALSGADETAAQTAETGTVEGEISLADMEVDRCEQVVEIMLAAYDGFETLKGEDLTPEETDSHAKIYTGTSMLLAAQRCQITQEGEGPVYSCTWRLSEELPVEESFAAITTSVEDCLDKGIVGEPLTFMSAPMLSRMETADSDLGATEVGLITRTYGTDDGVTGKIRFSASTLLYPVISVSFQPY